MAKRLIQRTQVIDCNRETCGNCDERNGFLCSFWELKLELAAGRKYAHERLYDCKNSERMLLEQMSKPAPPAQETGGEVATELGHVSVVEVVRTWRSRHNNDYLHWAGDNYEWSLNNLAVDVKDACREAARRDQRAAVEAAVAPWREKAERAEKNYDTVSRMHKQMVGVAVERAKGISALEAELAEARKQIEHLTKETT